jgi:hypothetical protein
MFAILRLCLTLFFFQEVGGADWNVLKPQGDSSEDLKIRAVMILLAKEGGVSEETARLVMYVYMYVLHSYVCCL